MLGFLGVSLYHSRTWYRQQRHPSFDSTPAGVQEVPVALGSGAVGLLVAAMKPWTKDAPV